MTGSNDLLEDVQRRTFDWFLAHTDPATGLVPDRTPSNPSASIAAVGFGLTAYPIGVERGWLSRSEARSRTLTTLRFFAGLPTGAGAAQVGGHHGFFYHFLDRRGLRFDRCELSTIDTTLLLGGVLFAGTYFDLDDPAEREVRDLADRLYAAVDWTALQTQPPLVCMGWTPEDGFIKAQWRGYNEAMLLYLLALASPTHPVERSAWDGWTATYGPSYGELFGQRHLTFGPLFGHQYSHVWVDFRGIADEWCRQQGTDYAENTRRATLAHRQYAVENPRRFAGYGPGLWGLTACDGPDGYRARGIGIRYAVDDGTVAPTAALGSLPFAPEVVEPLVEAMTAIQGLYGPHGFADAVNPARSWVAPEQIGIDQGPILTMIENHRTGLVWEVMRRSPYIRLGLERAGFTGGWLAAG